MSPDPYKDRILESAKYAMSARPSEPEERARFFVAALAGQLSILDRELAEHVWGLISTRPL